MFSLKISNANVSFDKKILIQRFYTTNKVLATTERIQIIDWKKFVIVVLDVDSETFVVYMATWEQKKIAIDLIRKAQIGA